MTDQDTTDGKERIVNVSASFISDSQTAELMQPTDRAFDHPSVNTQPAAMVRVASRNLRIDADLSQSVAMRIRVVCAVGVQFVKTITRRAGFTLDGGHVVDQLQQLRHIMSIGGSGLDDDRDAVGIGQQMVF